MKTSFTTLSLLLAVGFPGSVLAEIAGIPIPDAIDAGAFCTFVAALSLLILASDYARQPVRALTATTAPASPQAKEERRLAA